VAKPVHETRRWQAGLQDLQDPDAVLRCLGTSMSKPLSRRFLGFFHGISKHLFGVLASGALVDTVRAGFSHHNEAVTPGVPTNFSPAASSRQSSRIRLAFHCPLIPIYRSFIPWTRHPSRASLVSPEAIPSKCTSAYFFQTPTPSLLPQT